MKMPNLASLYHSGTWYFSRDSQSGRNGPWCATRSTSLRIVVRGPSYFALAFCQAWSITAGSSEAVGAVDEAGLWEYRVSGNAAKTASARPVTKILRMRDGRGRTDMGRFFLIIFMRFLQKVPPWPRQ